MGHIKMHALTITPSVTDPSKQLIKCRIHHRPKVRQIKMTCDIPHMYQSFMPKPVYS